ncbi:ATP/GTP-binding protein [Streptomyces sp. CC53]|uniref:ATP/GTP-binding protein n=1 Tax=unclassified Streptomyces TaxID=2593676 RepID=UPI003526CB06
MPPVPRHAPRPAPATGGGTRAASVLEWLRTPRPEAEPGVWRFGHRPRPAEEPDLVPARQLVSGALIAYLCGWLLWSLLWNGYLQFGWIFTRNWWVQPMFWIVPTDWTNVHHPQYPLFVVLTYLYYGLVLALIAFGMGRLGNWGELWRRYGVPLWPLFVLLPGVWRAMPRTVEWLTWFSNAYYVALTAAVVAVVGRAGRWPVVARRGRRGARDPQPEGPQGAADPAEWPELRDAGLAEAAARLAEATRTGALGDVDYARIHRAWEGVRTHPARLAAFTEAVRAHGAAACAHPSGLRDLPARTATHDLVTGQVRIGTAADHPRNPYARRTTGVALGPELLGTSLLAVGPAGAGKTERLTRPVTESLCLQALAGRAAVVAVTARGTRLAPDDAFDVVIAVGDPEARHDLDLYGGADEPDEAARLLAEALAGDLLPDTRRAATALAQLIGPYRAAHGHFPGVPELRELLGGAPAAVAALRAAVADDPAQLRDLDARARQAERGDDVAVLLAERIAFLDRPAFAHVFRTDGPTGPRRDTPADPSRKAPAAEPPADHPGRPFSLRAIEHPVRVRVDLPERGHAEASRIIARLVLAQFTEAALARADRSLFACLVLDDATDTVSADAVRGIQRLRSAHAGVVLALRTLQDVPEALHGPLLGAVGCRMAFAGLAPWDGGRFAEVWGTEWVQTRDVTNRQIIADEPLTRFLHALRRLVTGRAATAEAITVREVERQRWSASELAHGVPAGHAVLSLTRVQGEHVPPLLVDLRG